MKNFLPALNLDIRSTSTFEAFVWEEEARKHEWYEDIQCEWIEYFKSQLKISFTKRIQEIDSTPHFSYMKTPGWNVFDFFKTYSFPESKINFSEEWYRRYHPEEYQDLFDVVDVPEETMMNRDFNTTHKISRISQIYQNPNTSEERKLELITRYPSIRSFMNSDFRSFDMHNDIRNLCFDSLNDFLDFFFSITDEASLRKIFKIKKYLPFIQKLKEYNPYQMKNFNRSLNMKVEEYYRIYIGLFYESDPLDTIMHCISSKYITIEMIETHFDDIMIYYLRSRERIFENPHVNIEIYKRWCERIDTIELLVQNDSISKPVPMNLTMEFYQESSMSNSSHSDDFLELNVERAHWMYRRFQIRFVESHLPESILKHKLLEFL